MSGCNLKSGENSITEARQRLKRHAWRQRCHGEPDDWSKSHKSYSNLIEFGLDTALIEHFPPLTLPLNLDKEAPSLILMTSCSPCFFYTPLRTLLHKTGLFIYWRCILHHIGVWDVTSPESVQRTAWAFHSREHEQYWTPDSSFWFRAALQLPSEGEKRGKKKKLLTDFRKTKACIWYASLYLMHFSHVTHFDEITSVQVSKIFTHQPKSNLVN